VADPDPKIGMVTAPTNSVNTTRRHQEHLHAQPRQTSATSSSSAAADAALITGAAVLRRHLDQLQL
jgi:hypothetical protein